MSSTTQKAELTLGGDIEAFSRPVQQYAIMDGKVDAISRLPDELLLEIFRHVGRSTAPYSEAVEKCIPVPLVCRRWEAIYNVVLFEGLGFYESPDSSRYEHNRPRTGHRLSLLKRRLDRHPHLGELVRYVFLTSPVKRCASSWFRYSTYAP